MDQIIAALPYAVDGDLSLTLRGVAYQSDMSYQVPYDTEYWDKCAGYEGKDIANKINAGRVALVNKYCTGEVLDIGVGCGEFIRSREGTYGYDINPRAVQWLKEVGKYREPGEFAGYTFWDVIEHVENPDEYFRHVRPRAWVFVSIPVFRSVAVVRASKHYRPGEHLYYFTGKGFVWWMARHGLDLVERATFEMDAGREDIYSFAFQRR